MAQMVRPVALKLGASPVERPQANGRAEQEFRSVKERLRIIVAEMRKKGVEILESPTLTSWAARRAEWTSNHLVRSDVKMVDGSISKVSPCEAHAGKCAPAKLAALTERILMRAREEEPAQPRWKVGWLWAWSVQMRKSWSPTESADDAVTGGTAPTWRRSRTRAR